MSPANQPETSISKRELKFGYWLATHRILLRRLFVGFLGLIAASQVGLFVYTGANWLTHMQQTNDILSSLSLPIANYQAMQRPQDPVVRKAIAVKRDDKSIDLVVNMLNNNTIWAAAEITYEVIVGGSTTGTTTTALAPGEEKFLTKQSIPFSGEHAPAVQVNILNVMWQKFADRSRLPIQDWIFTNADYGYVQSAAEDVPFRTELTFTIQNKSVYGFREANIVVLLEDSDGTIHGIGSVILDTFLTEEKRDLTFRWPLRLPTNLTPVIYVNIDQLTEDQIIQTRE
jgi:hypothetical protein